MGNIRFTLNHLATISVISASVLACAPAIALYAQVRETAEPRTAAAVIADDDGWLKAETTGDAKYVNALLLPGYRSIGSDGSTQDKAAILARTAKNASTTEAASKVEKWKATHPTVTSVAMNGDTAIVTFALDKGEAPKPVMACDVFVYRDRRWRAIYSQHTDAGK